MLASFFTVTGAAPTAVDVVKRGAYTTLDARGTAYGEKFVA